MVVHLLHYQQHLLGSKPRLPKKFKPSYETERIACIGWKSYNNYKLTSSDLKEESAEHQDLHI